MNDPWKFPQNYVFYSTTRCHYTQRLSQGAMVQGMTEAFTDTLQKRAVQFTKKPYLPLFSSETADKFMLSKKLRHALHLVTAHLHRQNQVAHAFRTRDFWLAKLSNRHGGGILIYVRNAITSKVLLSGPNELEFLAVSLCTPNTNRKHCVALLYRPPSCPVSFFDNFVVLSIF